MDDYSILRAMFYAFLFMAYLILVFVIISDLMRDRKLSGWWKFVWIVALILVPWLTGLVYIIVRGRGMAERSAEAAAEMQKAQAEYIKQAAGTDPAAQIAQAKKLHDEGVISDAEFEQLKSKALAG